MPFFGVILSLANPLFSRLVLSYRIYLIARHTRDFVFNTILAYRSSAVNAMLGRFFGKKSKNDVELLLDMW